MTEQVKQLSPAPSPAGEPVIDFTAYRLPLLAVPCSVCDKRAGVACQRPSGHKANPPHVARGAEADRLFIAQHCENASIEWEGGGWEINSTGRVTPSRQRELAL